MKTKEKRPFILCFVLALVMLGGQLPAAKVSAAELDEADRCLIEAVELTYGEDMNITNLSYDRQQLFDSDLQSFGYAYSISCDDCDEGFALMVNLGLYYEVTEIFFNKSMPYAGIEGLPVYLTPMSYIEYIDGTFYDIESGGQIGEATIEYLAERGFGYTGSTFLRTETQNVSYTSKTEESYRIPGTFPAYYNGNGSLSNTCAVSAGATAIGYWGRYFPELVPNHTVGRPLGASYYYYAASAAVQTMIDDLYYRMGTNVGGAGTTAAGCRNGITSYVNSKGLSVTFSSVVTNTTLNLASYKSYLQSLKPILLFFNTYNLVGENCFSTQGTTDSILIDFFSGLHVVVSYGYKFVQYYNGSNNFRTDYYVNIFTGFADMPFGYVKLYDGAILQEGYAVNIS